MATKLNPVEAEIFMIESGLKPLEPFVNALAKWRCIHLECGQVVYAVYNQIRKGQSGCKPCGIKKRSKSQMVSQDDAVQMMIQAGLEPIEEYSGTKKPWKCKCSRCGKTVSPTYSAIRNGQGGCKYCARKFVDVEDAIQIMIAGGFEPLEDYSGAGKPWKSKCVTCGFVSSPTFANVQNGSNCSKCANIKNGLKQRLPEETAIAQMLEANLQPLEAFPGTKIPWKSKCLVCDHVVTPTLGNIIQGHGGCAYCSGHIVDVEVAVAAMVAAGLTPLEPYKGSDRPWKCKHDICGKVVTPSYASIRRGQGGCKSCGSVEGGRKNLFPSDDAIQIMLKAGIKPLEPFVKSGLPWKSECLKCHKTIFPSLQNVRNLKSKCIYCSQMKVDPEDAVALMRKYGFEPLEPYIDSKKKWKSVHVRCGNIVSPAYNTIQNRKGGCSFCADYGLKFDEPSHLYIMEHLEYRSIKVGISNDEARPNRIKSHESEGWVLRKRIPVKNGQIADYVETEILFWLRNVRKLGIHLSKDMMKQGGYSETVDSSEIDFLEIQRKIESVLQSLNDSEGS
jgi:hypothetical protein